jgi:hypothetical protein
MITAHQLATLRSVLRNGGQAMAMTTNGKTTPGYLRTTTLEGLRRAGLVSCVWTAKHTITKPGEATHDYFYFVTAKGCIAVNAADCACSVDC